MPYPADFNDTVVYNGVDLYIPKDCSCTVFEDSRVFLFGEWYLNGQPIMSGSAAISGAEVSVSTTQPTDPGVTLWFDTSAGYGELKVFQGGSWKTVEDPADATAANEVEIGIGQPVSAGAELWVDTSSAPENLKAKVSGSWKSINNEVVIGGVEPTDPNIELWVDTATSAPGIAEGYVSPGNAIGVIGVGNILSGLSNLPTGITQQITNNITVTLLTGRRYKVYFYSRAIQTGATSTVANNFLLRNGTSNLLPDPVLFQLPINNLIYFGYSWLLDGDGTTKLLNVAVNPGAIISVYDTSGYFYVEDLGPNIRPAYPLPSAPPDGYVSPGNALGVVAMGSLVSGNPLSVPPAGIQTTNNIAYTMIIGRRYRLRYSVRAMQSTAGVSTISIIPRDGTTNIFTAATLTNAPATGTQFNNIDYSWSFDGDNVARNFNIFINATVTSGFYTEQESYFYLEDIGPNTSPALPIPATPPAWIPVTFQNNWRNRAGNHTPMKYRKVGDIVQIEGSCENGTVNTTVFTLPVGFRPPTDMHYAAVSQESGASQAETFVDPSGIVQALNGVSAFHHVGHIEFSTTA